MNRSLIAAFYAVVVAAGSALMSHAWDGTVYVYLGENRSPAAIRDLNDFYPLKGKILDLPADRQVFESAKFLQRDGEVGVQLGHFLVHDLSGRKRFACQVPGRAGVYDRVELSFTAIGVAEDGKIPRMTVDAVCYSNENPAMLGTIWLPMEDIYHADPHSPVLELPRMGDTNIHFDDMASTWPEKWTLTRVRVYQSQTSDSSGLSLVPQLHTGFNRDALSFDWKPQ